MRSRTSPPKDGELVNRGGVHIRTFGVVTGGYWAFTVTDGAISMLVVLYFHLLGYSPFQVAILFLFYELFGVVTNLVGGWLGARTGLNRTMHIGMGLQVLALLLTVPDAWLSVPYVMAVQALSGIAKDLNKMSAKASVKTLAGAGGESKLFRWVALLTGSKNALKGAGFFVGAALLQTIGFRGALAVLAGLLLVVLVATSLALPAGVGKMKSKPRFTQVFSKTPAINWLSAARIWAVVLALVPAGIALALGEGWPPGPVLIAGLAVFGVVFAINSAVHSCLILAYSDFERVSLNVGFYYMANAGGRLTGTVFSGWAYQTHGLEGCLWWSAAFVLVAAALSLALRPVLTGSSPDI